MRLNVTQFRSLEGRAMEAPENPVLARLEKLERALLSIPAPQIKSVQYDNSDVLARLARIEQMVAALSTKGNYDFAIARDMNGKITSVRAVEVPAQESNSTIYRKVK